MRHIKIKFFSIFQLLELSVMRQIQLEMIFYSTKNILGAEKDRRVSRAKSAGEMEMKNTDFDIQELLQRDVYVNDKKVGTIVGERHHPNEAREVHAYSSGS